VIDHKTQFENWMSWKDNQIILKSDKVEDHMLFDNSCDELGITEYVRRKSMVRFKSHEDLAFVKIKFENLTHKIFTK
jgi:hypothetical protein